jgi:hypothetical protein
MPIVVIALLLVMQLSLRELFPDEPHMHIEMTGPQNQPPTLVASGNRVDTTAFVTGVGATASAGTPVASILR